MSDHVELHARYIFASGIHKIYGFGTTSSYYAFIIDLLVRDTALVSGEFIIDDAAYFGKTGLTDSQSPSLHSVLKYLTGPRVGLPKPADFTNPRQPFPANGGALRSPFRFLILADILELVLTESMVGEPYASDCRIRNCRKFVTDIASIQNNNLMLANPISVAIFGYPRSVLGLGEDARRFCDILLLIGCRVELVDLSEPGFPTSGEWEFYQLFSAKVPTAKIHIYCMTLLELGRQSIKRPNFICTKAYRIAYSPWELDEVPVQTAAFSKLFHEVWCSTSFQENVYNRVESIKTRFVPLYIKLNHPSDKSVPRYALDGNFSVGAAFDFNSTISRKNPVGIIRAFRAAFGPAYSGVRLVVKTINSDAHPRQLSEVIEACGDDDRIVFIDGSLDADEMACFLRDVDVFISLHRSEGFGRIIAEAMGLGTPVIATNWSGPKDFMNNDNSFLVNYTLRDVEPCEYPIVAGRWAEPNIDQAALLLREIHDGVYDLRRIASEAKRTISSKYSAAVVAHSVRLALSSLFHKGQISS